MRLMPACLTLLLVASASEAADKRAFAIEDLYRLKGISGLNLSPDGKRLLFQVSTQDLKKATRNTDLWMLELGSGALKQLTFTERSEFSPFWSGDGKAIFFLSGREGGTQLWTMDASGGEARRVTSFEPGVGSPQLLPGGNQVVFSATVFPEAMADGAKNAALSANLERGATQAHLADGLLYRHWTEWRDFQYTHLFKATFGGGVEALTSGKQDFPGYGQAFALSPDGKELCVVTNMEAVGATSTNTDLFLVSLEGDRTPRRITDNPAADGDPVYSPDGRYLAYRLQRRPGAESDRWLLAVYDRTHRTHRVLTEAIDNWVEHPTWSADGRHLWFTVQEKGRTPLCRVEVATGRVERMLEGQTLREFAVAPDQGSVVFTASRVGEPVEVFRVQVPTKQSTQLTTFNAAVAKEVDIRPAEELWVKGAEGKDIHVFVVKPHGFDPSKKYPLVMNVHGGPQMQWTDSFRGDWQVYPGAGYVVAFPNPHGSTGYGQAFTDAISGDWGGRCITDVLKVADHLAKLPYVDEERQGAMGWSWGGYAMMWPEGTPTPFKALAAMMGVYDLRSMHGATEELWFPQWDLKGTPWDNPTGYEKVNPSSRVKAYKTPCLVITGERDYRVPYTQSLQFFTDLQLMKVPSRLIVFKNDGHWPDDLTSMPTYYNAHLEWFQKWLGGGKAPWSTEDLVRNQAW